MKRIAHFFAQIASWIIQRSTWYQDFTRWISSSMEARNHMSRRMKLLERRMDYQAGILNRKQRAKLQRMLSNEKSCFYFTKPRSPLYIGELPQ